MELKELEFAKVATPGWIVVPESQLEALARLAAASQSVLKDWPQVLTDEEMDGCEAVDWIGDLYRKISEIQGMSTEPVDEDAVAEWVGLHYGKNYDACTSAERAEWIRRYQESHEESPSAASNPVSAEALCKAKPQYLHLYQFRFGVSSHDVTGLDINLDQIRDGIQRRLDTAYADGTLLELVGHPKETVEIKA